MIVIDTHIWIWWVDEATSLTPTRRQELAARRDEGIGVSIISCWEIAKKVEKGKLALSLSVKEWIDQALQYPGIRLLPLTPQIVLDSTQLPGAFHQDPADQLIVATARIYDTRLMTSDTKILAYPHVQLYDMGAG